jgi:hypothetical protein
MNERSSPLMGIATQPDDQPPLSVTNWRLPFELTFTLV